uniref:Uncharacterized protein n=1 Tax=Arundo donax TaxID=35708 RepID=A0A0A9FW58_ARUDO
MVRKTRKRRTRR